MEPFTHCRYMYLYVLNYIYIHAVCVGFLFGYAVDNCLWSTCIYACMHVHCSYRKWWWKYWHWNVNNIYMCVNICGTWCIPLLWRTIIKFIVCMNDYISMSRKCKCMQCFVNHLLSACWQMSYFEFYFKYPVPVNVFWFQFKEENELCTIKLGSF